jgi:hypothetical protein
MSSDKVLYVNPETKDVIAAGNVGIGTTLPTTALDVIGNIKATGFIQSSKGILQMQYITTMSLLGSSTTATAYSTDPLTATITPKRSNSTIKVEFFTSMAGLASESSGMIIKLRRSINGAAYVDLTPETSGDVKYRHGWSLIRGILWYPFQLSFLDMDHNSTVPVTYQLQYRSENAGNQVHIIRSYMDYGWTLTEIGN